MSAESFRKAIYKVVEYISKIETSHAARKLILYYFNNSTADSAKGSAIYSVEHYLQVSLSEMEITPRLRALLDHMAAEAEEWDREDGA